MKAEKLICEEKSSVLSEDVMFDTMETLHEEFLRLEDERMQKMKHANIKCRLLPPDPLIKPLRRLFLKMRRCMSTKTTKDNKRKQNRTRSHISRRTPKKKILTMMVLSRVLRVMVMHESSAQRGRVVRRGSLKVDRRGSKRSVGRQRNRDVNMSKSPRWQHGLPN